MKPGKLMSVYPALRLTLLQLVLTNCDRDVLTKNGKRQVQACLIAMFPGCTDSDPVGFVCAVFGFEEISRVTWPF